MTVRGLATRFTLSIVGVLAGASLSVLSVQAAQEHDHGGPVPNALLKLVRQITEPYKSVAAAEAAGYGLAFGCVSGPDAGAMGLHYVNMPLVLDGEIDPRTVTAWDRRTRRTKPSSASSRTSRWGCPSMPTRAACRSAAARTGSALRTAGTSAP